MVSRGKEIVRNIIVDKRHQLLKNELSISVDPKLIKYYGSPYPKRSKFINKITRGVRSVSLTLRRPLVLKGTWDLKVTLFEEHKTYKFIKELHDNNLDYTKTYRYQSNIDNINKGVIRHLGRKGVVLDSAKAVHEYLQRHVAVMKSMENKGYIKEKSEDSLLVMIGRNGELIKEEHGRHRLAIAQVLGIENVIAKVSHIHPEWVKRYEKKGNYNSKLSLIRASLRNFNLHSKSTKYVTSVTSVE